MPGQEHNHKRYLFIDESGDPVFYGKRKKLLVGIDGFKAHIVIAKKDLTIFNRKHIGNPTEFYTKGKIKYGLEIVPSKEMPELSIVDYLMWAVQRKLLTGESRFFDALQFRYDTILNLYDDEG